MPFLDLHGPLPIAAIDAAMGFPSDVNGGAQKRKAYYDCQLRRYAQYRLSQGDKNLTESLQVLLNQRVEVPRTKRQKQAGLIAGEMFKVYKGFINTDERKASWYNVITHIQPILRDHALPHSSSYLWAVIAEFKPAMHLWAAYHLRGRGFVNDANSSFSIHEDLDAFIVESEVLRSWGENWSGRYDKSKPPLDGDNWRPPLDWEPRQRHTDWPSDAGRVPIYKLTPQMMGSVRSKGRPAKQIR